MPQYTEFCDFLMVLIDVQIKKYIRLATVGVGPDARLNAELVYEEVSELLECTKQLLQEIESKRLPSDELFMSVFNQTRFYVEQERIRAYAGWLIDANNIHATVDDRTAKQMDKLQDIAALAGINCSEEAKPMTEIQRQCKYDSYDIALRILKLAVTIRDNPDAALDEAIPKHAQDILRRNARTRYQQFSEEINKLCQNYESFLQESNLKKNTTVLEKAQAAAYAKKHGEELGDLLERYKKLAPHSPIFSNHQWYEVASSSEENKPVSCLAANKLIFFTGTAAGLLLCYLFPYLNQLQPAEYFNSTGVP